MEHTAAHDGWYPAPGQPGLLRFWSGSAWSDRTRKANRSELASLTWDPDAPPETPPPPMRRVVTAPPPPSPAEIARAARLRGDSLFHFSMEVVEQEASVSPFTGATSSSLEQDPNSVLNEIEREGWSLIHTDFVFLPTTHVSRNRFLLTGQNIAVAGVVVGYYVFRRDEG